MSYQIIEIDHESLMNPEAMQEASVYASSFGVCSHCGRQVLLPCAACQTNPTLICLEDHDEQRGYEEVRNFRNKHGFPMWSEQWHRMVRKSRRCRS